MVTKDRSLKLLLLATSIFEGSTGLALMASPSMVIKLIFGSPLTDFTPISISRIAGSALVSLAIACWFSRKNDSAHGLLIALLFYNLASVVLLGLAGLDEHLNGRALWPAVITHIVMGAWCARCLIYSGPNNAT